MTKIIQIKELRIKEVETRELPKDIEEGVQVYWNELIAKYPGMFNGPVYSTINMENDDGIVTITCEPSHYAVQLRIALRNGKGIILERH